jgi:uncharacterized protein
MYNERMKLTKQEIEEINSYLKEYLEHPEVKKMAEFVAHGKKSVLKHCYDVTAAAYMINKKLKLNADLKTLLVGGLLHDFYLYDWHGRPLSTDIFKMHGFTHPGEARDNAVKYFNIDEDTQKVIESHMWPLTLRSFPSSKEAMIICMADKYCALKETFNRW